MERVFPHADFQGKGSRQGEVFSAALTSREANRAICAFRNMESVAVKAKNRPTTDGIWPTRQRCATYIPAMGVTAAPSLAGVRERGIYYRSSKVARDAGLLPCALAGNALFQAKAQAEGKTVKRVTVYSTPTCSWCNTLKAWLRRNNIPFTDMDVSRDEHAAQELVRRTGQQGVPQTDYQTGRL
jgi:glutaredoxin